MVKRSIRKMFPGGNTSQGFKSFFDNIIAKQDAARIFVIKGGPGVGKSTFMKKIGAYLVDHGYDIEEHHCSSDPDSLDGLVVPELRVALMDGTAPHIVDPGNPGAVDEIINLGDFWKRDKLVESREEITNTNNKIGRLFRIAYSQLKEAKVAYDEWKSYIDECVDKNEYNRTVNSILENIFKDVHKEYSNTYRLTQKPRHLFASAITPKGPINYIDSLVGPSMKIFSLKGLPGSGVKAAVARVAQAAEETGLFTEVFHCPFEPDSLDMVIIPQINTVVVNTSDPYHYVIPDNRVRQVVAEVNFNNCLQEDALKEFAPEQEEAQNRCFQLIHKAIEHIARAKSAHDEMEKYYIKAMDFKGIELKRFEVLEQILNCGTKR